MNDAAVPSAELIGRYKSVEIADESQLLRFHEHLPEVKLPEWWLFRGMPKNYSLKTTLERVLDDADVAAAERPLVERQLLKEFKRRAHHYLNPLPAEGDVIGWLAIMQHYGAPTRLLDWTYSFYVAAYFALANSTSATGGPCVVWALYRDDFSLSNQSSDAHADYRRAVDRQPDVDDIRRGESDNISDGINEFLGGVIADPKQCVWAVNSFRLNERQSVQQAVFLCPGDIRCSFHENLEAGRPSPSNLVRFQLPTERSARRAMLTVLHRMNISHASLFPGLVGFAQSLAVKVWVPGLLRPERPSHE